MASFADPVECVQFDMIRMKLMDAEEGEGWSEEQSNEIINEYKRFLILTRKHEDEGIVPSFLVDKVWHNHILDTQAYGPDCQLVFGKFLHHFPYWGMRSPQDLQDLYTAWDRTLQLYEEEFGQAPPDHIWASQKPARCPNCGRGSCFAAGTAVRMSDGSESKIEDLRIGDVTEGGPVTAIQSFLLSDSDELYVYRDAAVVTGAHAVLEDGKWIRVAESRMTKHAPASVRETATVVYCFSCVSHRIYVGDTVFADFAEVDAPGLVNVCHKLAIAELNKTTTVM
eukprot:TRINITY_DN15536_c0_g1_i1.p1 TRINITY_DN15536_c0_g1~~TRINITY_DN15536_c0_g1_i1.p1  ORF type:complete len:282 (-),score=52.31 TRINITY_DN15536_c0_g1_i1:85-930(-)